MVTHINSYCRNCTSNCGLDLEIEDGKVVSFRGDKEHPLTRGYFCIKGQMSVELLNGAEDRLLNSNKRLPDGSFVNLDQEKALDEIAATLLSIVERYGPRSVAVFQGTGAYYSTLGYALMKSFLSAVGTPNYFSTMTIDQSAKWVAFSRIGMMLSGKRTMDEADVILTAGSNPLVSHHGYPFSPFVSSSPAKYFSTFRARGGKLIVVDPRRTETARLADIHLQPYPGEDATLFAGFAHLILKNEWERQDFCNRFVAQMGDLRRSTAAFTPDYVAKRTGVPEDLLRAAAHLYGTAERSVAGSGTGPSMGARSNLAEHMIETINTICGGYRRAGEPVPNPGALFPRVFVEDVVPPNRTWEREPKCRTQDIGRIFGEFPTALLPQEIIEPGKDKIRALIVFAGNPAIAICDPEKTVASFKDLDLLVTLDPRMTETGRLSHYVIAATVPYERHDLTAVLDGMYPKAFAQYAKPVLQRPPGTMDDWEFFWGIASRMGHTLILKNPTFGVDYDAVPGGVALDMKNKPNAESLIEALCGQSALSFGELKAHPSGFCPETPKVVVQSAPNDRGARLDICPKDVALELQELRAEKPQTGFEYRLATRRLLETMNSAFRDAVLTRRRHATNRAYMNPDDMRREGLADGDSIDVVSEHGRIVGITKADAGLKPGVISMAHLWGALNPSDDPDGRSGGHTGRLVSLDSHLESINFMPRQTGIPVNISKRSP